MWVALLFFSKNISVYAIFIDQSFNNMFNDIVSFEQLGQSDTQPVFTQPISQSNGLAKSLVQVW